MRHRLKNAPPPRRLRRRLLAGGLVIALTAPTMAVTWALRTEIGEAVGDTATALAQQISEATGLTVREIYIANREQTPRQALIDAVGARIGDPMLALDLDAIRAQVREIGWVADVAVERRFPDRLILRLSERTPAAILEREGRDRYIDANGVILGDIEGNPLPGLKTLTGPDAETHAAALLRLLDENPALARQVGAAAWIGGRRWSLRLYNGITVHLPEENSTEAWARLGALAQNHQLLERDIAVIDMRHPDRLIIRLNGVEGTSPQRSDQRA